MALKVYSQIPSPCYVLEEALLRRNLEQFEALQQQAPISVLLALKGFALFHAFPWLTSVLKGASASSLWEARLASDDFGHSIHVYAPAYRDKDFELLTALASHLSFNSLGQRERFAPRIGKNVEHIELGLRINPEYSPVTTALYNPCFPGTRLGVKASALPPKLPPDITGFLCHNLCESNSEALALTLKAIEQRFAAYLPQIRWLNLGGGHLITQNTYDLDHAVSVLNAFHRRYPHLQLFMEPGSAVAWETGFLLSTVEDLIDEDGITHAMLDVSFTAHLPDCLEMPYRPAIRHSRFPQATDKTYRLGGASCLAGDFLGNYAFDQLLQVGDRLIFEDMMHYTLVKTTTFNGVHHPAIGCLRQSGAFELWRQFTYEDYRGRMG